MTRRPEGKRWSKPLLSQVVCTPTEPKLSLVPNMPAQRQVYLSGNFVDRFGPTALCKKCLGKGGNYLLQCRERLERCVNEERTASVVVEIPQPSEDPTEHSPAPARQESVPVAGRGDRAAAAADAQMTESRELREHRPVEIFFRMAGDESRALTR